MRKALICMAALVCLYGCNSKPATQQKGRNAALHQLFDQCFEDYLKLNPIEATATGDTRYNDKLYASFTESHRARIKAFLDKYTSAAKGFDREQLSDEDKIHYDCLMFELKNRADGLAFHDNYMPLEQIGGFHLTFAQLGSGSYYQPFATVKDCDNWLKRMEAFGPYMDSVIVYYRKGMAAHIVMPEVLVAKMIPQMKQMAAGDVTQSLFYMPIKNMPASFSVSDKKRLTDAYVQTIKTIVQPAFERTGIFLQQEYLPVTRKTSGTWDMPEGKAFYAYRVRANTSTDKTPAEIYETGLAEVKRIRTAMDSVKNATGFTGNLSAFFAYLASDKKFMPFHNANEILGVYRQIHERMKPQLKKLFLHEPKTPFEIRQVEAFRAKSSSSQYSQGSPDGKRPGVFYVLILDPAKYNSVEEQMESLFLHEAIPGHHYQISLQQEDTTLPRFRRFSTNNAYVEGWALYCESLGRELGLYQDPYQYFGALGAEMHRAIRLVVDAGMHDRKMTREEAIAYMMDNEQISKEAATIEIERYMAWPGQALGYKIGSLTIARLREECKAAMGVRFNIANFHNEILKYGSVPLNVLERHMREWARR